MEPETLMLAPGRDVPNNALLPVLLYRGAVAERDPAAHEALFRKNGWGGLWRNGIYAFHHYHTEGHEVLGVASGEAEVQLGGAEGPVVSLAAGDVVVLPAGTGHCRVQASADFLVVGGYPPNQTGDIARDAPDEAALARIAALPLPQSDPVSGPDGPLTRLWRG